MSNLVSRLARRGRRACRSCSALVYLGGWWLFALVAVAGGDRAARVLAAGAAAAARSRRPATSAALLALVGAQLGDVDWMVGGAMTTLALAFVLKGISEARQAADGVDLGDA